MNVQYKTAQRQKKKIHLLIGTLHVVIPRTIEPAIPVLCALAVHLVAQRVRARASRSPQQLALIVVRPAAALITVRFAHTASLPVNLEHVRGTILALTGTVLRQVALLLCTSALGACGLGLAGFEVAALAGCTAGVSVEHAGGRVAAGIVAVVDEAAVALLAGLDETVAADRRVEEPRRLVAQAVVHAMLEGQREVLQGA